MKKNSCALSLIILLVTLFGCAQKGENIIFRAVITDIHDSSITVTTEDDVGFNVASVSLEEVEPFGFNLIEGVTYEIEILPDIMESDPVQVIAVSLKPAPTVNKKITSEEAKEMMDEEVVILDVRTQIEYNVGYIEGAVLIPGSSIKELAFEMIPDTNMTILVYCQSGVRSETAAEALLDMGYKNVYDFGGINDWPYEIITPK